MFIPWWSLNFVGNNFPVVQFTNDFNVKRDLNNLTLFQCLLDWKQYLKAVFAYIYIRLYNRRMIIMAKKEIM